VCVCVYACVCVCVLIVCLSVCGLFAMQNLLKRGLDPLVEISSSHTRNAHTYTTSWVERDECNYANTYTHMHKHIHTHTHMHTHTQHTHTHKCCVGKDISCKHKFSHVRVERQLNRQKLGFGFVCVLCCAVCDVKSTCCE